MNDLQSLAKKLFKQRDNRPFENWAHNLFQGLDSDGNIDYIYRSHKCKSITGGTEIFFDLNDKKYVIEDADAKCSGYFYLSLFSEYGEEGDLSKAWFMLRQKGIHGNLYTHQKLNQNTLFCVFESKTNFQEFKYYSADSCTYDVCSSERPHPQTKTEVQLCDNRISINIMELISTDSLHVRLNHRNYDDNFSFKYKLKKQYHPMEAMLRRTILYN